MTTEVLPSLWILSEISVCVSISMSTISFTSTVLGVCANAAIRTNAGTTARARMFFISILPQSVDAEADLERIQNFRLDRCARLCGQLGGRSADTGRNAFQLTQRGLDEFGIRIQRTAAAEKIDAFDEVQSDGAVINGSVKLRTDHQYRFSVVLHG